MQLQAKPDIFLFKKIISNCVKNCFQKVPSDVLSESFEFERALADLILMVAPIAPHFTSELWAGLRSTAIHTKQLYQWVSVLL